MLNYYFLVILRTLLKIIIAHRVCIVHISLDQVSIKNFISNTRQIKIYKLLGAIIIKLYKDESKYIYL